MQIRFPIGDDSGDGHELCEWFVVSTAEGITRDDVLEAHEKGKDFLGFDINSMCSRYNESELKDIHIAKLKELGYVNVDAPSELYVSPEELIDIWIFFLNNINPALGLRVDPIPIFWWGCPGYGVFEC